MIEDSIASDTPGGLTSGNLPLLDLPSATSTAQSAGATTPATPATSGAASAPAPASSSSSGVLSLLLKLFPSITSGVANVTLVIVGIILLVGVLLKSSSITQVVENAPKVPV